MTSKFPARLGWRVRVVSAGLLVIGSVRPIPLLAQSVALRPTRAVVLQLAQSNSIPTPLITRARRHRIGGAQVTRCTIFHYRADRRSGFYQVDWRREMRTT
jgi:hypothetical protein